MIELAKASKCVGCCACVDKCAFNAISIKKDALGFLYPELDHALCRECHQCVSTCPVLNTLDCKQVPSKSFIMQSKNDPILEQSASGGFCTEVFARTIEQTIDVVFGAVYDEDFQVIHSACFNLEQTKNLSGSKYVQSNTGGIYGKVENALRQGMRVCFSGTPCQVAGLHAFLGKKYNNLITIDFLCHSVPSPRAWFVYLKNQEKRLGKITGVRFKSKKYGYSFPTLELKTRKAGKKEKTYYFTSQADGFMSAFLYGRIARDSCRNCQFRRSHCSDITVADYYRFAEITAEFKGDAGISRVIAWTEAGAAFVESVKEFFVWKEIDPSRIFLHDDFHDVSADGARNGKRIDDAYILDCLLKVRTKDKVISFIRVVLQRIGLQRVVKKIIKG